MRKDGREAVLSRIRRSLGEQSTPVSGSPGREAPGGSEGATPRAYRHTGARTRSQVLDLFAERVRDYRAKVIRSTAGDLPDTLARVLSDMGSRRLAVPPDLPSSWLEKVPRDALELIMDGAQEDGGPLSKGQLAACYGVLTGCAHAVAETGTIILDSGPGQGRRALTLLPDYHLCVVLSHQVLETVPEAIRAMEMGVRTHRRPLTLISGPSATSDIELIRVEGVHGPRNLEVIVVEEG